MFAQHLGVVEQRKALHLNRQAAFFVAQNFPVGGACAAILAVEHIGGMDGTFNQGNALLFGGSAQCVVQFLAGLLDVVGIAGLGHGIVAFRISAGSQNHIKDLGLGGIGAGRANADDVLYPILAVQLIGVDADGRHAHAAAHHADRVALVGTGITQHAAHIGNKARVFQKGFGNKLGAQGVAGHQHGFGKIAGVGAVVWGRHIRYAPLCWIFAAGWPAAVFHGLFCGPFHLGRYIFSIPHFSVLW